MKTIKPSIIFFMLLSCLLFSTVAQAAAVNWTEGVVEAVTTFDEHEEKVAAVLKLRQELLQVIESIKVSDNITVGHYTAENSLLAQKISYLIENASFVDDTDEAGKPVQKCRIPLYGISRSVISVVAPKSDTEKPFPFIKSKESLSYTGLVIDCRRMNYLPRLLPMVKNEQGIIIYSAANFDQGTLMSRGLVDYVNANDTTATSRAGKNPLIIKAAAVADGTIIITDNDTNLILTANSMSGFLQGAKVVIMH